jgi:hypothetical protein
MIVGRIIGVLLGVLPAVAAAAEPQPVRLSGSVRARYEHIDGQARPGFAAVEDLFVTRTAVRLDAGSGPVQLVFELFDSRAFGIGPRSVVGTGDVNTLELVQAHVAADLGAVLGDGSHASLRAGRMILNLGSRRIVAADEYRNTTNGYTGLRLDVGHEVGVEASFIYVLPQQRLPDDAASLSSGRVVVDRESFDTALWGGIAAWKQALGDSTLEASYFRFDERDSPELQTRDRHLDTLGIRIFNAPKPGVFDHEVEVIHQSGSNSAGVGAAAPKLDALAWFVHADLGYTFASAWKPRLSIEYDHASGDGPGPGNSRFDTLFGMRRADLAPSGIYAALGRTNILTPGVRLEFVPSTQADGFVAARALWAASATDGFSTTQVRDASGQSGRFAGYQLEGRLRQWLIPRRLRAEVNSVLLLRRGLLQAAPNAPPGDRTFYFSVALTTSF